ncbi:MAG: NUDIX domain-containing protein [Nanoarchaeota archaeon]|nr:NUDIX domain-containing protein [Nanoarchaeota archaeon]
MPIDNQKELFYLVDINDKKIKSIARKKAHSNLNLIHRSVGIFIVNEKNQMLMQKRCSNKDMDSSKWSYAVGGHVTYGQTYLQTATKEIQEELGIKVKPKFIIKALIKMKQETEYTSLYKVKISSKTKLKLDKDEVEKIQWVDLNQLNTFINTHPVVDWTLTAFKVAHYL